MILAMLKEQLQPPVPSGPHTPLDTSTAPGCAMLSAVATFSGLSPPARSQPLLAYCGA